jgi:hypothetical protein
MISPAGFSTLVDLSLQHALECDSKHSFVGLIIAITMILAVTKPIQNHGPKHSISSEVVSKGYNL